MSNAVSIVALLSIGWYVLTHWQSGVLTQIAEDDAGWISIAKQGETVRRINEPDTINMKIKKLKK